MASGKVVICVDQGDLSGVVEESIFGEKYLAFRGIPYAKPPVGPLRFKDPEPPAPWSGKRDASKFGDACAQFDMFERKILGSDDCLYLNVYAPINNSANRAVMVWLHGGGFISGSGDDKFYGPDYLLRRDIVLVTVNYRLGVLGFLNLDHEVAAGNQGLKDQVMALKWVQENISCFGGDPNNVTVFGESAGAASVHYLTISPMSKGLFHKAISQSGVALNPWALRIGESSKFAFKLAALLGEHSTDPATVVEFLRKIDLQKLIATEQQLLTPEMRLSLISVFVPVIDKKSRNPFLPEHPLVLMQSGIKVPHIFGFNSNEGSIFMNPEVFLRRSDWDFDMMNQKFELLIDTSTMNILKENGITTEDFRRIYFGDQLIKDETIPKLSRMISDSLFLQGIHTVAANRVEKNVAPTYLYKFTYDDANSMTKQVFGINLPGTSHGDDLAFLFCFKVIKRSKMLQYEPGSDKYRIMEYFTHMWTQFAKTGNPTTETTDQVPIIWKPLEKGNTYNYLNINYTLQMETVNKEDQSFEWKAMKDKL